VEHLLVLSQLLERLVPHQDAQHRGCLELCV
jgi:hypothetical protein